MPNIHPLVIHFPIVLLLAAVFSEFMGHISGNAYAKKTAKVALLFGTLSLAVAVFTGWLAHQTVPHSEQSYPVIETHQLLGFLALGGFSSAALFKFILVPTFKSCWIYRLYLLLSLASIGILIMGAHYGGKLVYEYGVGVKPLESLNEKVEPSHMKHEDKTHEDHDGHTGHHDHH